MKSYFKELFKSKKFWLNCLFYYSPFLVLINVILIGYINYDDINFELINSMNSKTLGFIGCVCCLIVYTSFVIFFAIVDIFKYVKKSKKEVSKDEKSN